MNQPFYYNEELGIIESSDESCKVSGEVPQSWKQGKRLFQFEDFELESGKGDDVVCLPKFKEALPI